jgi:hypothetical protein
VTHKRALTTASCIFLFVLPLVISLLTVANHTGDIQVATWWANALESGGWTEVYRNCETCNYPALGTAMSAGPVLLLRKLIPSTKTDLNQLIYWIRLFLGVFDGVFLILLFALLKRIKIQNALVWVALVGLLPATWIGGGNWGQIDSYNQMWITAALLCLVTSVQNTLEKKSSWKWLSAAFAIVLVLLFTKQLTVFTFPALLLFGLSALFLSRRQNLISFGVVSISVLFSFLVIDHLFDLPKGYESHLAYIWLGGGSGHINKIAGNGFNIWMFLGRDMWSSSLVPFWGPLTPKFAGIALFLVYFFTLTFFHVKRTYGQVKMLDEKKGSTTAFFSDQLLYFALTQLAFNVFLTGTHERYLCHFYPYAITAILSAPTLARPIRLLFLSILVFGGVLYGAFLYSVLKPYPWWLPALFKQHTLLAAFHLALLILLTYKAIRLKSKKG